MTVRYIAGRYMEKKFRMNKTQFFHLCLKFEPFLYLLSLNYRMLYVEEKVALTLYYLKDTWSIWITASTF